MPYFTLTAIYESDGITPKENSELCAYSTAIGKTVQTSVEAVEFASRENLPIFLKVIDSDRPSIVTSVVQSFEYDPIPRDLTIRTLNSVYKLAGATLIN